MQLFHTYLRANDCARMVWQHQLSSSGMAFAMLTVSNVLDSIPSKATVWNTE